MPHSRAPVCTGMRLFLPRRARNSFSDTVQSMPQNRLACCLAGVPNRWRIAAGTMQDGLSGTAEPKMPHYQGKPAEICTLRRLAVTVRCLPCQAPAPCGRQPSWPESRESFCTPFRVFPVLCHPCTHDMRSDLQTFRLITRELWRVVIGYSQNLIFDGLCMCTNTKLGTDHFLQYMHICHPKMTF